ncbi:MAG: Fic family protein [Candidatus Marithrix sp.]|nr:Fic family protein [Candidatus Marithrix sp.]
MSNENISLMEPMLISVTSRHREKLEELAIELIQKSTQLQESLPSSIHEAITHLVRSMNCYYSNLIEGHNTHPIDIENALKNKYSDDIDKRNLQEEAKAHIAVQKRIDEGRLHNKATTIEGICEIHRRFYKQLPEELLWNNYLDKDEKIQIRAGQLRENEIEVGRHRPISPSAVKLFLQKFAEVYTNLKGSNKIIGIAPAHHRLLWIHPFLDGNGRVARLMSYAMLLENLNIKGIWSVARGLARSSNYKEHLSNCDQRRRNDLDGRGNLSEEELVKFTCFFLETCLDQVEFMAKLMQPKELHNRILTWASKEEESKRLYKKSSRILEAILYQGELQRNEIAQLLDVTERQARRIKKNLEDIGVLVSSSPKAPFKLAFPAKLAPDWMPNLFPSENS